MNLNRIKADIQTAKNGISSAGNPTNDEYMYDISAYHAQQAVEKCLKYFLHEMYGADDTTKRFRTHNISSLLLMLDNYDKSFLDEHKELVEMSDEITSWEATTRYGEDIVATRATIEKALVLAEALVKEIELVFSKEENSRELEDMER